MRCSVEATIWMMGAVLLVSSSLMADAYPLMKRQHNHAARRIVGAASTTAATIENENDPVELPLDAIPSSLEEGLNLSNKEISKMSFRELQRLVRLHHPTNDVHGMTTSRLRETLRSLSNLCILRDDGVEDCSDDFQQNVSLIVARWMGAIGILVSRRIFQRFSFYLDRLSKTD